MIHCLLQVLGRAGKGKALHLEVLVEESSAEAALQELLPKILGENFSFRIHPFSGKRDLLHKLPQRLYGYRRWLPEDYRILILIDQDRDDCKQLKQHLNRLAADADLTYHLQILNRIAIEELEAWFLGDFEAVHAAYPRVPIHLHAKAKYRDPDSIRDCWETLERLLQRLGYYRNGMPKIETARAIARHMDPTRNRSRSFQAFQQGIRRLMGA